MKTVLKLEKVTKTYRQRRRATVNALRSVDLEMEIGEFRVLYGPSGSGKSTLLLCSGGLLHPDAGRVWVEGRDLYALPSEARAALRARRIGFVFQQFHLIPYLNVLENVLTPALMGFDGDPRPRAEQLIADFGLAARRDHMPSELSIGERQRVALARALLFQPSLLLADEPTGNLDAENGDRVMAALQAYAEEGHAVLVVTHERLQVSRAGFELRAGLLEARNVSNGTVTD